MKKKLTSDIVDLNLLNDCFFGETALQIDVINVFLTETPIKIKAIQDAIANKNHIEIKENAHYLKSTFSTLGVPLNEQYLELEEMAREVKDLNNISKIFDATLPVYDNCYREYQKIHKELSASL